MKNKLKIAYVSDLHLEFFVSDIPVDAYLNGAKKADVLILAGDIVCHGQKLQKYIPFFDAVTHKYSEVIYIPGNHEYYNTSMEDAWDKINHLDGLYDNLHVLNDSGLTLSRFPDFRFFGGTMWTNVNHGDSKAIKVIEMMMNDFRTIHKEERLLTVADIMMMHEHFILSAENDLSEHDQDYIFVTHHAPTPMSIHPKYSYRPGMSIINHAYSSDLEAWIRNNSKIKLWFHGHVHDSFDYKVGECKVLCNPFGYPGEVAYNAHIKIVNISPKEI